MSLSSQKLKIGIIDFVNALPFFYEIENHSKTNSLFEFSYGTPREINSQLEQGTLDTALISSFSFLNNRSQYVLTSSLGIAAQDEILSVRLFHKGNLNDLSVIYVPNYSETSVALLKILCKHFWNINPRFIESSNHRLSNKKAFLSIGDDCLRKDCLANYSSIDLGHAWYAFTQKPFVYAVFATRNESLKTKRHLLKEFNRLLEAQLARFEQDSQPIIQYGAQRAQVNPELIEDYFHIIDYRFSEEHFSGLEQYASFR